MSADIAESLWFVLRDLTRPNALRPAYRLLSEYGIKVFTPMTTRIVERSGRRIAVQVPFIHDLLFAYTTREILDPIVRRTPTLQYRFVKGLPFGTPLTVPTPDMQRFIAAISAVTTPRYLRLEEVTPSHLGARVRIVSEGPLNGFEGRLLRVRGSGKKRLVIELPGILAAAVEVADTDYIQLL